MVIALASNFPALAAPMLIDGYRQPGALVNTSALAFNANLCVLLKPLMLDGISGSGYARGINKSTVLARHPV